MRMLCGGGGGGGGWGGGGGGGAEIVCVCSGTFCTLAKRNKTIK